MTAVHPQAGRPAASYDRAVHPGVGRGAVVLATAWAALAAAAGVAALADLPPLDSPYLVSQFCAGLTCVPVGAYVAWRRPDHRLGPLLLAAGAGMWFTFAGQPTINWVILHHPTWTHVVDVQLSLSIWTWIAARGIFLTSVPLCFPDARPRGRWRIGLWWAGILITAVTCLAHTLVYRPSYFAGEPTTGLGRVAERIEPWGFRAQFAVGLMAIVTMLVGLVRRPAQERRRHAAFAMTAALLLAPSLDGVYSAFAGHGFIERSDTIEVWTLVALPVVLGVGIVRRGLLDIEVILRRTTLYACSAGAVAAVYALVVWVTSTIAASDAGVDRLLGTAAAALVVMPAYVRTGDLLDRRFFGSRRDPRVVLRALGESMERSPQGTAALDYVVATIQHELRVPFVAVDLLVGGTPVRAAHAGVESSNAVVEQLPMSGAEGEIGALLVARRTPREPFGARELAALTDITAQVSVIASNVLLTEQLQASRRSLVQAREEERRRVRRDLHDGLGPTLASVCLGLGAAAEQIGDESALGVLLHDLEGELRRAIDDIRRLVYELRPPALDELGLVGAVREHVDALSRRSQERGVAFEVRVDAPTVPQPLPAAAEVAAYRIVLEAIANVARHAQAHTCWVRIATSPTALEVEVSDDGVGIDADTRQGVGLRSMGERAAELGGRLHVVGREPNGTRITAILPIEAAFT